MVIQEKSCEEKAIEEPNKKPIIEAYRQKIPYSEALVCDQNAQDKSPSPEASKELKEVEESISPHSIKKSSKKLSNETNRIWYNAKLRYRLVVERTVYALLESQIGVLEHFKAMVWDSIFVDPTWVYSEALARFRIKAQAVGKKVDYEKQHRFERNLGGHHKTKPLLVGLKMKGGGGRQFNKEAMSRPRQPKNK
ncbi:hypothetical protein M9H77_03352 [Catharanthus roseus]|uniref:Uncharacterized protein n=1 Tax=Catharanthus roseus TaxID=4058 RepID=A0ACC0CBG0_CATRO|nr:hypothetical protein M9H77_03352 [Catharanthus roseus]